MTSATSRPVTADAAGTWRLGDLTVRRIGLGAMRLTGTAAFHNGVPRDRGQALAVLRRAVELGVDHIDTAAFYFSSLRSANELINRALAPYPDDLVIATKVGPGRDPSGTWLPAARPDQLRGQVEENLRQLGRDHLDLVNLRVMPSVPAGGVAERMGVLDGLRAAGLIRHLGVSNVTSAQLAEARATAPVVCVQNMYGLADRRSAPLLRECGELGLAFVPFYSIAGEGREMGAGTAPGDTDEAVADVAARHGVSATRVRLAWTLAQGAHVLAIPGTGDPDHLEDNLAAGALRLTAEDMALLDASGSGGVNAGAAAPSGKS